jgi:hypothetical protein
MVQKKSLEELVDKLAISVKDGFDRLDEKFDEFKTGQEKIIFNTNGLENRVSTLEDKMRVVSTKLGLK